MKEEAPLRSSFIGEPRGVIPGFYTKTKYSSYEWPGINCSTHTAKRVHRKPNVMNKV
jgi:hypothetical protein